MRTAIAISIGIVLAFCFQAVASSVNRRRGTKAVVGPRWFLGFWLIASVVDLFIGVRAGHGVALELGVHALIFAVPATFAWYWNRRRRGLPEGIKDIRPSSDE
jgi:hypothetical protein